MSGGISDRCKRICGEVGGECFIANEKQLECLVDMVINKAYGVILCLDAAMSEQLPEKHHEDIVRAKEVAGELISWVKYLQLTRDLRKVFDLTSGDTHERRRHTRFPLPEIYRSYISLDIELAGFLVPVKLENFSSGGLQFVSEQPLNIGTRAKCRLSTVHIIKKAASFNVDVVYCKKRSGEFVIGARVVEMPDNKDFDFFESLYDFLLNTSARNNNR